MDPRSVRIPRLPRRAFGAILGLGSAQAAVAPITPWLAPSRVNGSRNRFWRTAMALRGFEQAARTTGRGAFPIWEILDFAAQLGFDGVELCATWPMGPLPRAKESTRVRALRRQYEAFGLQIATVPLDAAGAFHPDAAQRAAWQDDMIDRIELAKALGCGHVTLSPSGTLGGGTLYLATQLLIENLQRCAETAEKAGLVAVFEVEPPFVFNSEKQLVDIHRGVAHASLRLIYDISHFDVLTGGQGRPQEMLRRVGIKNIGLVRLADSDGALSERGGTSKHLPVGDGHSHPAASLSLLKEGGYRGWVAADTFRMIDPYAAATKAKALLDQVAGRV